MSRKNSCKYTIEAASRSDIFFLVREMLFKAGKNQGILKSGICGNHVHSLCQWIALPYVFLCIPVDNCIR